MKTVISPLTLILTPVKQHIGCCVVAPLLLKLAGMSALAQTIMQNETAEFLFLIAVMPPAVYGILKLEDFWRARHEQKHVHHNDPCTTHCAHKKAHFQKRFIVNLLMAFALALVLHLAFHQHH